MAFEWLNNYHQETGKEENYAERVLAAYRQGIRAKNALAGVTIVADPNGCGACRALDATAVYHPDEAPRLPLPACDREKQCGCLYRPVMANAVDEANKSG